MERYAPEPARDDSSVLGARPLRTAPPERPRQDGPPDAFALFAAYHLGVTIDDRYQKTNVEEVARRYSLSVEALRQQLVEFGIDEASLRKCRYDLEAAQVDIRVAPEGISRLEIARELYQDFLDAREALGQ